MTTKISEKTDAALKVWAKVIAMHVRNSMEGFHEDHLSDAQMRELNPIVRNAIYDSLRRIFLLWKGTPKQRLMAFLLLNYDLAMIPGYWEEPHLTKRGRQAETHLAKRNMEEMAKSPTFSHARSKQMLKAFMALALEEGLPEFDLAVDEELSK